MVTTARRTPVVHRCPAPTAGGPVRRCFGCGRRESAEEREIDRRRPHLPAGPRWLSAGDLDVIWLLPSGMLFAEARFCLGCAPSGPVMDAACRGCAGGPLVLLDETLPGMPVDVRAWDRAVAHLRRAGWRTGAGGALICPGCPEIGECANG